MFRIHILLKLVERSNLEELRKLLLLDSKISREVAWLLQGNLFPQLELINDGRGIKYNLTGKRDNMKSYSELLEQVLATKAFKFKLNPEDILEIQILESSEVTHILPFKVNENAKYLKITFRREIINFIILLIDTLHSKYEFSIRTHYTDSEVYFEFRYWYKLEKINRENFWIWYDYWGWGRPRMCGGYGRGVGGGMFIIGVGRGEGN